MLKRFMRHKFVHTDLQLTTSLAERVWSSNGDFAPFRSHKTLFWKVRPWFCIHISLSGYWKQSLKPFSAFTGWDCATSLALRVAKRTWNFGTILAKLLGWFLDPLTRHVLVSISCWQQHFQQHGVCAAFECKTSIAARKQGKKMFFGPIGVQLHLQALGQNNKPKNSKRRLGVVQLFLQRLFCIRRL